MFKFIRGEHPRSGYVKRDGTKVSGTTVNSHYYTPATFGKKCSQCNKKIQTYGIPLIDEDGNKILVCKECFEEGGEDDEEEG